MHLKVWSSYMIKWYGKQTLSFSNVLKASIASRLFLKTRGITGSFLVTLVISTSSLKVEQNNCNLLVFHIGAKAMHKLTIWFWGDHKIQHYFCIFHQWNKMCLRSNPGRKQSQNVAKSLNPTILTLLHPPWPGHVMSFKCQQPLDELKAQFWFTVSPTKL